MPLEIHEKSSHVKDNIYEYSSLVGAYTNYTQNMKKDSKIYIVKKFSDYSYIIYNNQSILIENEYIKQIKG